MGVIAISKLMTVGVKLASPQEPLRKLAVSMQENNQSCVLIGTNGSPTGIITERDLVRLLSDVMCEPELANQPAASIMSSPVHTINVNQTLFDALVISHAEGIRHLPVVDDDDQLVGILTNTDLANAHFNIIEQQSSIIETAISERTEELQAANEKLHSLSMEDPLLGIGNRRAMEADLQHTHSLAIRHQQPYTVAIMDVDHFKLYNDEYGHPAGDLCLQEICNLIKMEIRGSDRLYRYGGEEFLLLLTGTTMEGGKTLVERVVQDVEKIGITHCKSPLGVVTISAGLASYRGGKIEQISSWPNVIEQADQSLYQAKELGRNRVA